MHPVYSREYVESIVPGHRPPKKVGAPAVHAAHAAPDVPPRGGRSW